VCSSLDTPVEITSLKDKQIEHIACGPTHSAVLTSSGQLYLWGRCSNFLALKFGTCDPFNQPRCVSNSQWPHFTDVKCGAGMCTIVLLDVAGMLNVLLSYS